VNTQPLPYKFPYCTQIQVALDRFERAGHWGFEAELAEAHEAIKVLRRTLVYCPQDGYYTYWAPDRAVRDVDRGLRRLGRLTSRKDEDLVEARNALWEIRRLIVRGRWARIVAHYRQAKVSRRTRYATALAVGMLPPGDRDRYGKEFAAELADLPRCDQAGYAIRLVYRGWSLRRSLTGRRETRSTRVVVTVAVSTADGALLLMGADWPAALLGAVLIGALMWTVNSEDRTRHLVSLLRAARKK
jgi:hypothetical protein